MTRTKPGLASMLVLGLLGTTATAGEPAGLSEREFRQLFQELDVKNQAWTSIPWMTSVTEARREAARQKKPIFFNVNTGNCLGWT